MMADARPTHLIERAAAALQGDVCQTRVSPSKAAIAAGAPDPDHSRIALPGNLAEQPYLPLVTLQNAGLALSGQERTRISEECRITVGQILRTLGRVRSGPRPTNLLMVTSSKPREGKSFIALNIAASIALNELSGVLIVDLDFKLTSITSRLGLADAAGLFNLVVNPALRAEETIVRTAIAGLLYLPVGTCNRTSLGPGMTRPVSEAIERISRRFSHCLILLDCASCLSSSDPSTLAPLVDQVVMVIEAERTQRSEIETSLELIKACQNVTLLLNKVRLVSSSTFGANYDCSLLTRQA